MCVCVSVLSHRCSCSARREPCASETREGRTGAQDACSAGTLTFGLWRGKEGGKLVKVSATSRTSSSCDFDQHLTTFATFDQELPAFRQRYE